MKQENSGYSLSLTFGLKVRDFTREIISSCSLLSFLKLQVEIGHLHKIV